MARLATIDGTQPQGRRNGLLLGYAVLLLALLVWRTPDMLLWLPAALVAAPLTLLALLATLLLPGLALLRLCWRGPLLLAERLALGAGLSCAVPPLLFLLSSQVGLRWNSWLCWVFLVLCGLVVLWPQRTRTKNQEPRTRNSPQSSIVARFDAEHLLLLGITLVALAVRLYAARELPVGMFGDSYHHTIVSQLLVDHGGLFTSWQPYAPLVTFTYHFGFQSLVAWLHWLSGTPVTQGLLLVGQVQSALAAPMVYLLTRRLTGSGPAALWAALLAGLVSSMPAYYLNWGRYTQLAGQTVLPAVVVVWMALLDGVTRPRILTQRRSDAATQGVSRSVGNTGDENDVLQPDNSTTPQPYLRLRSPVSGLRSPVSPVWLLVALAALSTAGLALTHYRVAVFAACFVVAYGLYLLLVRVRSWRMAGQLLGLGWLAGGLGLLLLVPWISQLREGYLLQIGQYFVASSAGEGSNTLPSSSALFDLFINPWLLALALAGLALLLWQRRGRGLTLVGAAALIYVATNPRLVGLGGGGIITNFAILIAVYMVLAPLAGVALAWLGAQLARFSTGPLATWGQLLVGTALLVWALGWQATIMNPGFQLLTRADETAMAWIRQETPPDAAFFVNSFPAYGNTLFAGSDGGWWLAFLTGRQSSLPPLTYGSEAAEEPDFRQQVFTLNSRLREVLLRDPDEAALALKAAGYSYLYNGPAANPNDEPITQADLSRFPAYELLYDQEGVQIWRLR